MGSDWLIGDNVLRSIYSVYDFGDFDNDGRMGNPYVKLLSLVDPNKASAEFHQLRGGAAATNITYNAANSTSSPQTASGSVEAPEGVADTINKLNSYLPAMLAIMALNALVILLLVVAAFVYMFRRRGKARARKNPGRMTPMPMNPPSTSSFMLPGATEPSYQPVSMALTEDTFVPPSPAFQKDGGKLRPMSVA
jgi:saccharopepsin